MIFQCSNNWAVRKLKYFIFAQNTYYSWNSSWLKINWSGTRRPIFQCATNEKIKSSYCMWLFISSMDLLFGYLVFQNSLMVSMLYKMSYTEVSGDENLFFARFIFSARNNVQKIYAHWLIRHYYDGSRVGGKMLKIISNYYRLC